MATILNQVYEEDFLGFSYGFRPGRSQHDALDTLSYALLKKKVNYVLDADIRGGGRQVVGAAERYAAGLGNHAPYAEGNFQFERTVKGRRTKVLEMRALTCAVFGCAWLSSAA